MTTKTHTEMGFQQIDATDRSCDKGVGNYCVPLAIATAERVDFDTAHDLIASFQSPGRKHCPCCLTHYDVTCATLEYLGYVKYEYPERPVAGRVSLGDRYLCGASARTHVCGDRWGYA